MNDRGIRLMVSKAFNGFALDCQAELSGGVTAIFGPSGSGKTTLLNCIAGLISPDEGIIEISGLTVFSSESKINLPPEKRRCGYVFQDACLFPHMKVRENVFYGYNLTPIKSREIDIEQLIQIFRLSPLMDRTVANLSGGERHRVALARALATSPKVLLLDEPLVSLDAPFRGAIIEHLKRVAKELRIPMLYVTHSLSEVLALADEVVVLDDGRKLAQGRPPELLVQPDVSYLSRYDSLENILPAMIMLPDNGEGTSVLRIGEVDLIAPVVYQAAGDTIMVSVRAADIILSKTAPTGISARNIVSGDIDEIHEVRERVLLYIDVGTLIIVEITLAALRDLDLSQGESIFLIIKTSSIIVLHMGESD